MDTSSQGGRASAAPDPLLLQQRGQARPTPSCAPVGSKSL
jgi:hypothetical protein